jgi:hypothetical protein
LKKQTIKEKLYLRLFHKPLGTQNFIEVDKVYIPHNLFATEPKDYKVIEYYNRYSKYGVIDKPLLVSKNKNPKGKYDVFLQDGYIRFLIVKNEIREFKSIHKKDKCELPNCLKYIPIRYK